MARPREFEIDEALDKAMDAFWSKGYEATSMADLTEAMGLKKGSIYTAFGDKHSLFIDALTKYTDTTYAHFKTIFAEAKTPYEGMRMFLTDALVDYASGGKERKGCFATNTLVELGPHDSEVNNILKRQYERIEKLLEAEIKKGQEAGEFRKDISEQDLATEVSVMMSGIMADCKSGNCVSRTQKAAETFLKTITT